jgi:hypothetical protein
MKNNLKKIREVRGKRRDSKEGGWGRRTSGWLSRISEWTDLSELTEWEELEVEYGW